MKKVHPNTHDLMDMARSLIKRQRGYMAASWPSSCNIYGVPRGGVPAAYLVQAAALMDADTPYIQLRVVDDPEKADLFIDDIEDSGKTKQRYARDYPGKEFDSLVKSTGTEWVVFPWEGSVYSSAEDIPTRLLQFVGEDVEREGLRETPARFLRAWEAYTAGYAIDPVDMLKEFGDGAENYDEMVVVNNIPVYSHCEHHLAPFFGTASVGYIPNGKVVGLSKLARLVDIYARRLQVQERLTQQVANALLNAAGARGVGVTLRCRHMCMEARGVRTPGSVTVTSSMLGALKDDARARAEFLQLQAP